MKRRQKIKVNIDNLVLEKKIAWKRLPVVIKEITMGSIPPEQLLNMVQKKN